MIEVVLDFRLFRKPSTEKPRCCPNTLEKLATEPSSVDYEMKQQKMSEAGVMKQCVSDLETSELNGRLNRAALGAEPAIQRLQRLVVLGTVGGKRLFRSA